MRQWSVVLLLALLLSGCGYRLVSEATLPDGLSRVKIATVGNRTTEPLLDSRLQRALGRYLALQPGLILVRKADDVEAVVEAEVVGYRRQSFAYRDDDKVAQVRVIIAVDAGLRRQADGVLLWREKLQESQEYLADDDLEVRENREEKAVLEMTGRLAETIVARMQASF